MAWVKLDDQFADHPKVVEAGPLASWLYVCGLTYSARLLTDGFIPIGQVRKLADVKDAKKLADILVKVGLWDAAEDGSGYHIHDYLQYNPSRDKTLALREERARAGERGGKQKASNLLERSQASATEMLKQNPTPSPTPTRPVSPTPIRSESMPVGEGEYSRTPPRAYANGTNGHEAHAPPRLIPLPDPFVIPDDFWEWADDKGYKTNWVKQEIESYVLHYSGSTERRTPEGWINRCQKWIMDDAKPQPARPAMRR